MIRRVSSLLLAVGLVAAVVAAVAVSVESVVLDPARVRAAGPAVLSTGPVRRELVPRVAAQIRTQLPAAATLTPAQLDDLARTTLSEPSFVHAFSDALVHVRGHVFAGERGAVVLDAGQVATAIARASDTIPALGGAAGTSGLSPRVVVDVDSAPDLHVLATAVRTTGRLALAIAALALALAVPSADRPRRALARVARFGVVVGIVQIVMLWLLPRFALSAFGAWPDVGAALTRAAGARAVLVALAGLTVATAILVVVARMDASARRRLQDDTLEDLRRRTQWSPPPLPPPRATGPRRRSGV